MNNIHKISNLYINTSSYQYVGFFSGLASTSYVKDLYMENVNVTSTYYYNGARGSENS